MNTLLYFLMLSRTMSTGIPSIRNLQYPVCKNCVFFIEHTNNYPYDPVPDNAYYGKCTKFGEMNLVTGCIEYDFAKLCREDVKKCGWRGAWYQEKVEVFRSHEVE